MEYLLFLAIGTIITYVVLLVTTLLIGALVDMSLPPWPETAWKLAAVALATNATSALVQLIHPLLTLFVPLIVFYLLMKRWFDLDLWGLVILLIVSWLVRMLLTGLIVAAMV